MHEYHHQYRGHIPQKPERITRIPFSLYKGHPLRDLRSGYYDRFSYYNTPYYKRVINNWKNGPEISSHQLDYLIEKLDLPKNTEELLNVRVEEIKSFLVQKNVKYDIAIGSFNDPEYNWTQVEIRIKIDADLKEIYKEFKPKIYELILNGLPDKIFYKLVVILGRLE